MTMLVGTGKHPETLEAPSKFDPAIMLYSTAIVYCDKDFYENVCLRKFFFQFLIDFAALKSRESANRALEIVL